MQTVANKSEEQWCDELQALATDYARSGETQLLAAILQHGLPVNLPDVKGNTSPMLANYNGNLETTRALLGQGADVDRHNDHDQTSLGGVALKGYEARRDDSNDDRSPAIAAAAVMLIYCDNCASDNPIRILTIAAALVAAEIDRLRRRSMTS